MLGSIPKASCQSHQTFLSPDIQQYVLEHLEKDDQARVARVSKALSNAALNAVYKSVECLVGIFGILGKLEIKITGPEDDGAIKKIKVC